MYAKDTILSLKQQREPDPETGEEFPYNRVRVIGASPVSKDREGFTGPDAAGVLLCAETNFGGNLDEPFGKLKQLYDVESIPEIEAPVEQKIRIVDSSTAEAGPTPEEVFATEAPGEPPEEGQRRGRGGVSPLGDAPAKPGASPLDAPVAKTEPAPAPPAPPVEPPAAPATPAEPSDEAA